MSNVRQSFNVGVAMGADIAINYPLWIAAKRLSVGLSAFPSTIRGVYTGAGSLWISLGPTGMLYLMYVILSVINHSPYKRM